MNYLDSISGLNQPPQFNLGGQDMGAYAMPSVDSLSQLGTSNQAMGNYGAGGIAPGAFDGGGGGVLGGIGGWLSKNGNAQTALGGIQALGSAYLGFQQLKQAKDALNFQKKSYNTNLTNSTQSYNTSLEDRINGRTADYAGKAADVNSYLASHELKMPGG